MKRLNELRIEPRLELAVCVALAWLAFISIPIWATSLGLSWDALNHQIYLGWIAEHLRLDQDFLAAGYQSLTFPYLYWPVYRLAASGVNGTTAGVVLASMHVLSVPALWMIARVCVPGENAGSALARLLSVALAFMGAVVLSQFDSTSNDMLAAAPVVWAVAFAMEAFRPQTLWRFRTLCIVSGLFAGLAVACKLSNGPIVILLPIIWLFAGATPKERVVNTALACVAVVGATVVFYGYWGWQLWARFGNPVYPFYEGIFAPLRAAIGWSP